MQSVASGFKYPIGTCLHEGERQSSYETVHDGSAAILKFFRADTPGEALKLIEAVRESEPRLLDCGEAEVFQTQVVYAVAAKEQVAVQPAYRKYAGLAIGGAVAAAALCLLLIRGAEHKTPTPPSAPVAAAPVVPQIERKPEPVAATPAAKAKSRHKRKKR